jgi:hypothetical protein
MNSIRETTHFCIGRNSHLFLEWSSKDRLIEQLTVNMVCPHYLKNRGIQTFQSVGYFYGKTIEQGIGRGSESRGL